MVSNPHFYGQSTTGTPNQIEDGVDFPHTGIIKALSDGLGQNYGISGFDITIDSATQIDVGAGVIFRDGKREGIDAVTNLALGRTTASQNSYHLVVVDKNDAIVIRSPSAQDKVVSYTKRVSSEAQGDTIIAMVTHTGNNPMPIQYLTVDKAENSLSIGYSNSGTYTETATITGASGVTTITAASSSDVKVKLAGTAAGDTFEVIDSAAQVQFKVQGDGEIATEGNITVGGDLTVTGGDANFTNGQDATIKVDATTSTTAGRDLTIEAGSTATNGSDINGGDLHLKSGGGDGTGTSVMTFSTKISGTDTVAERMRIHSDGNVGIGTASPTELLHLSDADGTEPTILIENTGTSANEPELVFWRSTGTGADSRDIGHIKFKADDTAGNLHTFVNVFADSEDADTTTEDGRLLFYVTKGGTDSVEQLRISGSSGIIFNDGGADIDVRIEGDTDANLLVTNAGSDKVGIGTNAPVQKLQVSGSMGAAGFVGAVTEITGHPSTMVLNITPESHRTIIADTQTFNPSGPSGGPLSLTLPAASSTHQGFEFRIIAKNNAGGGDNLILDVTGGSDLIIDATGATIGNASAGLTLVTGKVYTVIHVNSTMYMALLLN